MEKTMISVEVEGALIVIAMLGTISEADWDGAVLALDEKLGDKASIHLTL
jgi:hypothetical protein